MALDYSWANLKDRVFRHINNDFPNASFSISDNEALLYINEAMSFGLVGQVWQGAKITGVMEVPDAYNVKFELAPLQQDKVTRYWETALPQPPLSLPLGYSVKNVYFADEVNGRGIDCILIKGKRVGRRLNMPRQYGVDVWFENKKVIFSAFDGGSLANKTAYAIMPSTRAVNITDPINLPDDANKIIFDMVVARIKERLGLPQDIVQDDLPSGNKSS